MTAEPETKSGYTPYRDRHPVPRNGGVDMQMQAQMPPDKSVGAALLLTFLFGPLGLFYASVVGGLVMLVVTFFLALVTLGLGLPIAWCGCMIWGAVSASGKHSRHQLWLVQQIGQGQRNS